jgi:hypothetical protein
MPCELTPTLPRMREQMSGHARQEFHYRAILIQPSDSAHLDTFNNFDTLYLSSLIFRRCCHDLLARQQDPSILRFSALTAAVLGGILQDSPRAKNKTTTLPLHSEPKRHLPSDECHVRERCQYTSSSPGLDHVVPAELPCCTFVGQFRSRRYRLEVNGKILIVL